MAIKGKVEALFEDLSHDDVSEVFRYYQKNPVKAAEDIFNLPYGLPPHQKLALNMSWTKQDVLWIFSRGTGKSWMLSLFAALSAILYPDEKIGIFGPSFRQAKFVWAELTKLYDKSPVFKELCVRKPVMQPDMCHLQLSNGSIIDALPLGMGDKIRGARYFRIIGDEAAQIPEDILDVVIGGMRATTKDPMENVYSIKLQREKIAKGLLKEEDLIEAPKNKLLLASTAFYKFNHLWRTVESFRAQVEQNPELHPNIEVPGKIFWNDERACLMFTKDDAPEGFMDMKSIEENRKKMSEMKFRMEYYCEFASDSQGFFKRSKIDESRSHKKFTVELFGKVQDNYVMGIDVARKQDNFAIAIGKMVNGVVHLVRVITLNSKNFPEMHDAIRACLQSYNISYICMDTGGGGTALEDHLKDERMCPPGQKLIFDSINNEDLKGRDGAHILEMIKFSDDSIPIMSHQLQADLDHGRLLFPTQPSLCNDDVLNEISNNLAQYETEYMQIEETIEETTSILAQATRTGKIHLGLPGEMSGQTKSTLGEDVSSRKDRWVALMLMNWAAFRSTRVETEQHEEPAYGFALIY